MQIVTKTAGTAISLSDKTEFKNLQETVKAIIY